MIDDELTKKLAEAAKKVLANDNTNDKSDDGEGLDKVQPKAVKKKFADRKDKDIDNDGDVDSSDEYLHKRRKAISKATKEETELEESMPKTKEGMLNAMYGQLKNMKKDDLMATYDKIMNFKYQTDLEEATELFQKGKITFTKFSMGRGKGVGLQINYGRQYIQVPEKDIKQLYTAMVYVTKSVPQFKESVEIEEGFYYDSMSPKDKKRLNNIYKEMDKNEKQSKDAIKKGDAKTVDKLGKEYHKLRMQVVNFYNESVEVEEETLEEASKDWEVVVTMGVNKLKKGQKTVVKARNSAEAIKKAAKEFNINDKLITGKVDANLKESVELEEGKFDKLQKKLGRINPETLGDVMDGKIKLNPVEKKEFDEFMKGVRKMFASK